MAEGMEGASKKAKQRARKKAAAAEQAEVASPAQAPAPEPKAKAKAKAKAAEPKPAAQAPPPPAEPKTKASPKARPLPTPEAAPPAKAAAKGKAKAKAAFDPPKRGESPPQEQRAKKVVEMVPYEMDDGSRKDEWEVATAVSKKNAKRQQRVEEEKAFAKAMATPGSKPPTNHVPGMAKAAAQSGAPAVSQSVAATPGAMAAMQAAQAAQDAAPKDALTTENVNVPEKMIGRVIGPKGATLKMIQEKTGVTRIDTTGNLFTVMGSAKSVKKAVDAINELLTKGHTSLAYDDYAEAFVQVHPTAFPSIIGEKGWIIRKIKEEVGAEIEIPPMPKAAPPPGKKFRVNIAGGAAQAAKAKEIIMELLTVYHSEITHPGYVHEELEIADWAYRFIIGTKGSELKHIQSNYKVKVHVPREYSLNKNVVVVGEPRDVERAKAYIEKTIWNAEHAPRGRGQQGSAAEGDTWGDDDDDVDEDAQRYLYKRR